MILLLALACTSGGPGPGDGNRSDGGASDGGATDGGATDGGATDGGGALALTATPHERYGSLLVVTWQQPGDGVAWLAWTLDGEQATTAPLPRLPGPQQQLLAGVPYATTVAVELWSPDGLLASTTATTADLPADLPVPSVLASQPASWDPSLRYVLLSTPPLGAAWSDAWWTSIVDRQGRVVWAHQGPRQRISMHVQPAVDGRTLLLDENSYWTTFDGGAQSVVQRMKLDGTLVETVAAPGLHHAFTELPDGRLAWGATDDRDETLAVEQADGSTAAIWSCDSFLASIGESGYCGSNTLRYDADRDSYLFSFYSVETVFEIDATTGQTLRWFGHLDGSYAFDPPDSAFWWQHGSHWTEAGTLLLSSKDQQRGEETVVREYQVDEDRQALVELWSFGEGQGVYGSEMGEAWRLPGGNTLHNYGSTARLREVTPDGQVVWDLDWGSPLYLGRTTALQSLDPLLPDPG
ncbi:hypothetical protein L6R53_24775 [Myxococcota bacterium]|nr:hypothetical protein [Myxococcota bacterium]